MAHQKIESMEEDKQKSELALLRAELELEARGNNDKVFADKISELQDQLSKEREDKKVHMSHKDTLRNMLEEEKKEHTNTKGKSEEELRRVEAEQRQRATARIFKLQVSQKKAAKALEAMEVKHKNAIEKIVSLEKIGSESETREEAFRQELADRQEGYRRELNTANNLRHKAVSEFDTMKEIAENSRCVRRNGESIQTITCDPCHRLRPAQQLTHARARAHTHTHTHTCTHTRRPPDLYTTISRKTTRSLWKHTNSSARTTSKTRGRTPRMSSRRPPKCERRSTPRHCRKKPTKL